MTDKQFFELIDQLVGHGKLRRQQSLQAADVEQFKEWDSCVSRLDNLLTFQRLKELIAEVQRIGDAGRHPQTRAQKDARGEAQKIRLSEPYRI